ncbi:MAG: bifunctional DNA-formamidopyrimidine glycosylase/DNA-(apurinic or apyrimidinic site) lyase [Simplicispira suum]|uniref:bifunctional DNA-formamidopyrimidine glycosylase/DNA-(apurinic or apyrimidinic site) lyase n=1 Tax=Simplicispira suum TaxID=2109915 RepID=UPI001C6BDA47|nr:bifunctional DNA-formamidopyrimidine glycosylase/DNA-(apurinic or apyrimidinic site) lyase [Simplicispira suum]MBW7832243.1 bifunctional DNA-formamidopyrimidine glycosylase/DNA-(apurinic or apyrimidinic site) lyase [Simplicispira suum]
MPELPEVEVTRRSFSGRISGAAVLGAALGKPLRWPLGCEPGSLAGRRVADVERRGKYLLLHMDQGLLLLHLGMSGSLSFSTELPAMGPHDHFDLHTDRGHLRLHDPRRFGAVVWAPDHGAPVLHKLLGHLGMEPLSPAFSLARFAAGLKASRSSIKQLLLSGRLVVGVGNIYASEALFRAGIRPTALAHRIGPVRVARLHAAIGAVLEQAVSLGGSTLRDFQSADGSAGHFQLSANVYGRAGAPCHTCSAPIKMLRQGQRSSFYCPVCQRS